MDVFTVAIAVVAALSEVLPLLGFTQANGIIHGLHQFILHLHADSACHLDVDVNTVTQTAPAPGAAEGPATIAALAETPP
jgi:hypothetical protein